MAAAESYPEDVRYHREHDWARIEDETATLGITWYAQDALGEIVHYEAPEEGSSLARDESYGEGWLVKIQLSEASEVDDLMDADAYKKLLEEQ